jgi:hypothetical protein
MNQKRPKRRAQHSARRPTRATAKAESEAELTPEQARHAQEWLLERIGQGAALCRDLEERLRENPAPELETIIKLYRMLVLTLSAEVRAVPELRHLVTALMRPIMEWARLEQKRAERAARPDEQRERDRALRPATMEKIEDALTLF